MIIKKKGFLVLFFCCTGWVMSQQTYSVLEGSKMAISGTSTAHDWEVVASVLNGSLSENEDSIHSLKIEVTVAEIKSERGPTMDTKMYAALKAEEHATILFTLKELSKKGAFVGSLTIAGVAKEVSIEGALLKENDKLKISGTHDILLKDYGMDPPTAMFGQIVVGDTVTVMFDLIFLKE